MPSELVAIGARLLLLFAVNHCNANHYVERLHLLGEHLNLFDILILLHVVSDWKMSTNLIITDASNPPLIVRGTGYDHLLYDLLCGVTL